MNNPLIVQKIVRTFCAKGAYFLIKKSVLFKEKVRTIFFAYVSLGTVASHFHITTFVFEYSTSC